MALKDRSRPVRDRSLRIPESTQPQPQPQCNQHNRQPRSTRNRLRFSSVAGFLPVRQLDFKTLVVSICDARAVAACITSCLHCSRLPSMVGDGDGSGRNSRGRMTNSRSVPIVVTSQRTVTAAKDLLLLMQKVLRVS